jgi:protein regulator of cytokinesis 1
VREWHALVLEEEELERLQNDPDRFKRRGGAMLKEEKSRKRVMVLKPKVCLTPFTEITRSFGTCCK